MAVLRSCFDSEMHVWGRDQPPIPVRWFFCAKGAKVFPEPHDFGNPDWYEDDDGFPAPVLFGERGAYHNGSDPVGYKGDNFHGPLSAYKGGGIVGETPALQTDDDGALPECKALIAGDEDVLVQVSYSLLLDVAVSTPPPPPDLLLSCSPSLVLDVSVTGGGPIPDPEEI